MVMGMASSFFSSPIGIFHIAIFLVQTLIISVGPDKSFVSVSSAICTFFDALDKRSVNNVATIVGNIVF